MSEIKMKGIGCTNRPEVGEICLVSGANCDDDFGYTFGKYEILWKNNIFLLYGAKDCWPNLAKWDHVITKPITPSEDKP